MIKPKSWGCCKTSLPPSPQGEGVLKIVLQIITNITCMFLTNMIFSLKYHLIKANFLFPSPYGEGRGGGVLLLLLLISLSVSAQDLKLSHADSLRIDSIERSYNMNEVVVQSQRKLISNQVDRVSYDVKADEESKTSTILQMLRKVPMVSV
ncbi:MAG: hypothetical protein HUK05_05550, partial [Prevotella sp.]|nr:hypothetical protein [Prevotella sp.]